MIALYYIGQVGFLNQVTQILALLPVRFESHHSWQSSVCHKLHPCTTLVTLISRIEFLVYQRVHMYLVAPVPEFCHHICREHFRVAASYIDIHIPDVQQPQQNIRKPDSSVLVIKPGVRNRFHFLNLVQHDVVLLLGILYPVTQVLIQLHRITVSGISCHIKF